MNHTLPYTQVQLSRKSTFRIGGLATHFLEISREAQLIEYAPQLSELSQPTTIGAGSNILFPDEGISTPILQIRNMDCAISDNQIEVGAGLPTAALAKQAQLAGLDLTPFYTIPGSIGGAIAGNAGWPPHNISDHLITIRIYDWALHEFRTEPLEWLNASYRHTRFHDQPVERHRYTIWSAILTADAKSPEILEKRADAFLTERRAKQPTGRTAGSFFMNPAGDSAGRLLDSVGAKQMRVGGAYVSPMHANFMMNDGTATAHDIINLAQQLQQMVMKKHNILLHPEVRILDTTGNLVQL